MEENNQNNEAIVLGVLRKQKSSKPIFAFVVLALILGFTFALPLMGETINNPNTFLGKIYYNLVGKPVSDNPLPIPTDEPLLLNEKTNIKFDNILITNVSFNNQEINYSIRSTNDKFDLDEDNYYFEIYSSNEKLLETINLSGTITNLLEERTFSFKEFKFNNSSVYFGKVIKLKSEEYKPVNLSGRAIITCSKENNEFKYTVQDEKLVIVNRTLINTNTSDIDSYLREFERYNNISSDINKIKSDSSATVETNNGFKFTTNLDLEVFDKNNLKSLYDSKYFKLGKEAKIIIHDMKLEGFICK